MPFDGLVAHACVYELKGLLEDSRIEKVFQTERDEIVLLCHTHLGKYRLLISCNASNSCIRLTQSKKENPAVAPPFSMVLRKHIQSGRILSFSQEGFDRVIRIAIETRSDMGDMTVKYLIAEIMGKHSNIILTAENGTIYDAIKHVDNDMSSVREIMPLRKYTMFTQKDKVSPLEAENAFREKLALALSDMTVSSFLLSLVSGFSPLVCEYICVRAGIDSSRGIKSLNEVEIEAVCSALAEAACSLKEDNYVPCIINAGKDFHCLPIVTVNCGEVVKYNTVNIMLDEFYTAKDGVDRLRQKKASTFKTVNNALERCKKKIGIHEKTIRDCENYDKYRIRGELLTANIYRLPEFAKEVTVENFYEDPISMLTVALDENKSVKRNAQIFFNTYRKKKRSYESAAANLLKCYEELEYIESVSLLLENAVGNADIAEIKQELISQGYEREKNTKQATRSVPSSPMLFEYEGYRIFVGKNNRQNDKLTLKDSNSNDMWFHVKGMPGSHTVLKLTDKGNVITSSAVCHAAELAAWFSSGRSNESVDVDYTYIKYVHKPQGGLPGKVIYTNYKTIRVKPTIYQEVLK